MSSVNPDGYGAVIIKIYSSKDEIIEKITGFSYKHSEEGDDECVITVESNQVDLPDREEFQEGAKLHVLWGYINGVVSTKRTVFIRDIKCRFTNETISLTLMCYDKYASAKQNTSQKIHKNTDADKLAKEIAEKYGLKYDGVRISEEGSTYTVGIDKNAFSQFINWRQYTVLPQGNKPDSQLLDELLEREKGGPYVVEGRDEELIIKKRDLLQTPIKTYTYGGGSFDLIDFEPETKNRAKKSANVNIESAGWDPINKEFIQVNSNAENVDENYLGDNIDGSARAYPILPFDPNDIENQDNTIDQPFLDLSDSPEPEHQFMNTAEVTILQESGYETTAIDESRVQINAGILDYSVHEDTVEDNLDDIKASGDNRKQNASLQKNPATATIIGDPSVVSGKVITILNVSKKYSGNYYITEARHHPLFATGYLMTLTLVKNATGKIKHSHPASLETKELKGKQNKAVGPEETTEESTNRIPEITPSAPFDFKIPGVLNQPTIP